MGLANRSRRHRESDRAGGDPPCRSTRRASAVPKTRPPACSGFGKGRLAGPSGERVGEQSLVEQTTDEVGDRRFENDGRIGVVPRPARCVTIAPTSVPVATSSTVSAPIRSMLKYRPVPRCTAWMVSSGNASRTTSRGFSANVEVSNTSSRSTDVHPPCVGRREKSTVRRSGVPPALMRVPPNRCTSPVTRLANSLATTGATRAPRVDARTRGDDPAREGGVYPTAPVAAGARTIPTVRDDAPVIGTAR